MSELHKPGAIAGSDAANAHGLPYIAREDCDGVRYPGSGPSPFTGRGAARGRQAARDEELRRDTLATIGQLARGTANDVGNLLVAVVISLSRLRGGRQAGDLEETVEYGLQVAASTPSPGRERENSVLDQLPSLKAGAAMSDSLLLSKAGEYRAHAEKCRATADSLVMLPKSRAAFLLIVAEYERMAENIEQQAAALGESRGHRHSGIGGQTRAKR